jgi:recombination associated protein RdgC
MLFTHLHFYTIHPGESGKHDIFSSEDLCERLEQRLAKPLAESEGTRLGWTAPAGKSSTMLLHEVQHHAAA